VETVPLSLYPSKKTRSLQLAECLVALYYGDHAGAVGVLPAGGRIGRATAIEGSTDANGPGPSNIEGLGLFVALLIALIPSFGRADVIPEIAGALPVARRATRAPVGGVSPYFRHSIHHGACLPSLRAFCPNRMCSWPISLSRTSSWRCSSVTWAVSSSITFPVPSVWLSWGACGLSRGSSSSIHLKPPGVETFLPWYLPFARRVLIVFSLKLSLTAAWAMVSSSIGFCPRFFPGAVTGYPSSAFRLLGVCAVGLGQSLGVLLWM